MGAKLTERVLNAYVDPAQQGEKVEVFISTQVILSEKNPTIWAPLRINSLSSVIQTAAPVTEKIFSYAGE